MRALLVPFVAVGALFGAPNEEPTAWQMRFAFEDALSLQVRNALEFVSETGDEDALKRIRDNGTDLFSIRSFEKLKCEREDQSEAYRCQFSVELVLTNGTMQRVINGRFHGRGQALTFNEDA